MQPSDKKLLDITGYIHCENLKFLTEVKQIRRNNI